MVSAIRIDDESAFSAPDHEQRAKRTGCAFGLRAGVAQEAVLRERLRAPGDYDDCALYVRFAP